MWIYGRPRRRTYLLINYVTVCVVCRMSVHCLLLLTQLDNQLAGAVFSTVLAPVPPPKTVAAESGECSLVYYMR